MSLIRSNILKIFQSTVYVLCNFPKKARYGTFWYCLVLVTTTIRENHSSKNAKICSVSVFQLKKIGRLRDEA